jgi:vacuolar-type H+-ATPase subunit F/Vma7
MSAIDERLQRKIDSIYRPIVVSLPIKETLQFGEDHRAYLSRLIRRAIGFDITLRRG